MRAFLSNIKRAVLHPAEVPYRTSFIRQLVLRPVVFDLVSLYFQWRDMARQRQIMKSGDLSDPHFKRAFDYNAGVTLTKEFTTTRRAEPYFHVLTTPKRDLSNEKLLIIGPRNSMEFIFPYGYGYQWKNISAIDLYATHPKTQIMNMEDMTFPDASFDAILMSRVFPYAKDPKKCLSEAARVLKPGGRLVFEANYVPMDKEWPANTLTGAVVHKYLKELSLRIYFLESYDKVNSNKIKITSHLFAVKKVEGECPNVDTIEWSASSRLQSPTGTAKIRS